MTAKHLTALLATALFWTSCSNSKIVTLDYTVENRQLDTVSVTASSSSSFTRPTYNPSATRTHDLVHTKLDVSFDWQRQYLNGKALLEIKPIYQPSKELRLDAKGFDIHKVAMLNITGQTPLQYRYDNNKDLYITLDREYQVDELFRLHIIYTAKPNELPLGGSAAITSDKGLYFINPLGEELGKPQQIWTQGETESSSCWFPTIDRPNERCTQEIYITVQQRFQTLSNGILVDAINNSDGTRTDYWKMDQPHAPYLFAMVVGEFAVVEEEWDGILLQYFVEPKYRPDAKEIYKNTPQMLTFFSERFGVPYPWPKYSQAVVRDYVSGAMENTTAVIFGDFIQKTRQSLLDNSDINEGIVAHELAHHWFGNLVTCESWANLPLNESFANYSEYLWFEHQYGRDAADHLHKRAVDGYMNQAVANGDQHPLIYYGYDDKEDMFDAHSYNKGGLALHMLRKQLGDEAFFASLNMLRYTVGDRAFFAALQKYLTDNNYQAAEAAHLRLAFEEVTGQDLNWFFDQWFFTKGHPNLEITKEYDAGRKLLNVTVRQTQSIRETTVFILPFAIDVYTSTGSKALRTNVRMTQPKQTFSIPVSQEPVWVSVDAERMLLARRNYKQSEEELIQQYKISKLYQDRSEALSGLRYEQDGNAAIQQVFEQALNDPFWAIRVRAIDGIKLDANSTSILNKIAQLAKKDPRPQVRRAAIQRLTQVEGNPHLAVAQERIDQDSSYMVMAASLQGIYDNNPALGIQYAERLKDVDNVSILLSIANIYAKTGERNYLSFFENNWKKTDNYALFTFMRRYADLIGNIKDDNLTKQKTEYLRGLAMDATTSKWGRYAAASAIKKLRDDAYVLVDKDYKGIETSLNALRGQDVKDAIEKVQILRDDKSSETYQDAVDAIERLRGEEIATILERIEAFARVNTYDHIDAFMTDIINWEQDENLLKLYGTW